VKYIEKTSKIVLIASTFESNAQEANAVEFSSGLDAVGPFWLVFTRTIVWPCTP
jgi:hypothetical protein